jgi:hypothetical protein
MPTVPLLTSFVTSILGLLSGIELGCLSRERRGKSWPSSKKIPEPFRISKSYHISVSPHRRRRRRPPPGSEILLHTNNTETS